MLNIVLEFITALGTIVAVLSIVSAFVLYRIGKRDEYLSKVRYTLQLVQNNMKELNNLLNFELEFELVNTLLFSPATHSKVQKLFIVCNDCIINSVDEKNAKKRINEALGVFGVSFQTELTIRYNDLVQEIRMKTVVFSKSYPGLYRFSKICAIYMRRILFFWKKFLLDEEYLTRLIYSKMVKRRDEWKNFATFRASLMDLLIIDLMDSNDIVENRIDSLLELVDIVCSVHMKLSNRQWAKLARANRKIKSKPYNEVETIPDDLREAEKYFRPIMDRDSSNKYSALVQKIDA